MSYLNSLFTPVVTRINYSLKELCLLFKQSDVRTQTLPLILTSAQAKDNSCGQAVSEVENSFW